jgi:hypothetical protein
MVLLWPTFTFHFESMVLTSILFIKTLLTSSNQIGYVWNIARRIHNFIRYSYGFCGIWQFKNIFMNLSKYSLNVWFIGKLVVLIYSKRKNYTCKWSPICYKGVNEFKQAKFDVKMSIFLQLLLHLFMWCHFNGMWIMESYVYWIIWILKYLKWIKQNSNIKVWFE